MTWKEWFKNPDFYKVKILSFLLCCKDKEKFDTDCRGPGVFVANTKAGEGERGKLGCTQSTLVIADTPLGM